MSEYITNTDWADADLTLLDGDVVSAVHTNIKKLTIPAGNEVTVKEYSGSAYGTVEFQADEIEIIGDLLASGKGFGGGGGGGSGASSCGNYCTPKTGGAGGAAGGGASAGSDGEDQVTPYDDNHDFEGKAGGTGGDGGGTYKGTKGSAGAAAPSSAAVQNGGAGGAGVKGGYAVAAGQGDTSVDESLLKGSGGGGAGGGGGGNRHWHDAGASGGGGSAGGLGGGYIKLIAVESLVISGNVYAKGIKGENGTVGANAIPDGRSSGNAGVVGGDGDTSGNGLGGSGGSGSSEGGAGGNGGAGGAGAGGGILLKCLSEGASIVITGSIDNRGSGNDSVIGGTVKIFYGGTIPTTTGISKGRLYTKSETAESPSPPTSCAAVKSGSDIVVTWADNSSIEDGYKVERRINSQDWVELSSESAGVETYTDNSGVFTVGNAYTYRVRAYKGSNYSSYSISNTVNWQLDSYLLTVSGKGLYHDTNDDGNFQHLINKYNTGLVTDITNKVVTFNATTKATRNMAAGDKFWMDDDGFTDAGTIDTVDSATQITLLANYAGSETAGAYTAQKVLTDSASMEEAIYNRILHVVNNQDESMRWDTVYWSKTGNPAPTATPTGAKSTGGGLNVGVYLYKIRRRYGAYPLATVIYGYSNASPASADIETEAGSGYTDTCSSGTALEDSHNSANVAVNAFDDDMGTWWQTNLGKGSQSGAAYIGYDYGVGTAYHIRRFVITQYVGVNYAINSVKIQYSDNGTDWTTVETIAIVADDSTQTKDVAESGSHRYWRLLANAETSNFNWTVKELEFQKVADGNQQITLNNLTSFWGDHTCVALEVYRTLVGGAVYYYVGEETDDTETDFVDDAADSALVTALVTDNNEPPTGADIHSFKNRMWYLSKDYPDRAYYSKIGYPGQVPTAYYETIETPEGDKLTKLTDLFNKMTFIKENSIWFMDVSGAITDWSKSKASVSIGFIARRSVTKIGNQIIALALSSKLDKPAIHIFGGRGGAMGLYLLEDLQAPSLTAGRVETLMDSLDRSALGNACGIYYDGKYYLSVTTDGSSVNDKTIVVDSASKVMGITTYDYGVTDFLIKDGVLLGASPTDKHIRKLEIGNDDDEDPIAFSYDTGFLNFKEMVGFDLIKFGIEGTAGTIEIDYSVDNGEITGTFEIDLTSIPSRPARGRAGYEYSKPFPLGVRGRSLKLSISRTGTTQCRIKDISISLTVDEKSRMTKEWAI